MKLSLSAALAIAVGAALVVGAAVVVTSPPPPGTPPPAQPTPPHVQIANFTYVPGNLTVKVGTTVNWTNTDAVEHTVTVGAHGGGHTGAIDSGLLAQNRTFSYTFDTAGTFAYHCDPHPFMMGNITVTA